jgi:hypothetical protein
MPWRYLGSGGTAPEFLTSALGRCEWSSSCPGRFTPREIASVAHWIGGYMGHRAGLEKYISDFCFALKFNNRNNRCGLLSFLGACFVFNLRPCSCWILWARLCKHLQLMSVNNRTVSNNSYSFQFLVRILSRVRCSVTNNYRFWSGWLNFLSFLCTVSLNYNQYSAFADLHTFQFTFAHALGFCVSTSRILATDLNTGTVTLNHCEVFLSFLLQSLWTADSLNSNQFSNSISTTLYSHSLVSWLCTHQCYRLSLYRSSMDHTENTALPLLRGADHIENTSALLLATCLLRTLPRSGSTCHTMIFDVNMLRHLNFSVYQKSQQIS